MDDVLHQMKLVNMYTQLIKHSMICCWCSC